MIVDCLSTFYSYTYYSTFPTSNPQPLISKFIVLFLFHLNWAHSFTFFGIFLHATRYFDIYLNKQTSI